MTEESQERCGGSGTRIGWKPPLYQPCPGCPDCEKRCPTCGSDNPGIKQLPDGALCEWKRSGARNCPDPFHQPPVEEKPQEARCKRCQDEQRIPGPCPDDLPGCCVLHWFPCPDCQPPVEGEGEEVPFRSGYPPQFYFRMTDPAPSGEDGEEAVPWGDCEYCGGDECRDPLQHARDRATYFYAVSMDALEDRNRLHSELTRARGERDEDRRRGIEASQAVTRAQEKEAAAKHRAEQAVKEREEVWAINQDLASDAQLVRAIQERDKARSTIATLTEERDEARRRIEDMEAGRL